MTKIQDFIGLMIFFTCASVLAGAYIDQTPEPEGSMSAGLAPDAPSTAPTSVMPHPAEIMPKASQALVLGIADTGAHLVAVGGHGDILVSNDGQHWAQVEAPVRSPLTAVSFSDQLNGWAVGHDAVILHTADGGRHWMLQNFQPELENPFLSVLALDKEHIYAVGAYGLFYKSDDGGAIWTPVDAPTLRGDQLHLYSIRRLGNGDLLIAGEQGLLALSRDGGKDWKRLKSPYEGTFFGAVPVGKSGALLCGLRGNAYLTRDVDAGSWKKLDTTAQNSLFGCESVDATTAVMVGLNGIIQIVNTDSGAVHDVDSPGITPYSDVVPFKGGLVLVGESGIQHLDNLRQGEIDPSG